MLILFDSWAWLEFLLDAEHKEKVRIIYQQANSKIITSKISIYEVYAKIGSFKGWQIANNAIEKIIQNSFLIELELDVIKEAAHLKNEKGMSTADSIIAATAIKYHALLLTGDNDFDILKDRIKIKQIY